MYTINKVLAVPHKAFQTGISLVILEQVERHLGKKLEHVEYREVTRIGANRRFHISVAFDRRDKETGRLDNYFGRGKR